MERRNGLYRNQFPRTEIVHPPRSPLEQASQAITDCLLRIILAANGEILALAIAMTDPKEKS